MRLQPLHDKLAQLLVWAGSRVARGKITVSGAPNCLNYCVIYIVLRNLETWPMVGDSWPRATVRV